MKVFLYLSDIIINNNSNGNNNTEGGFGTLYTRDPATPPAHDDPLITVFRDKRPIE